MATASTTGMLPARRRALEKRSAAEEKENCVQHAPSVGGRGIATDSHRPNETHTDEAYDPEAWRAFSMDTPAGRMLSKLYQGRGQTRVNYPKLRRRARNDGRSGQGKGDGEGGETALIQPKFIPAGGKVTVNCRGGGEWREKQKEVRVPRMGAAPRRFAPIELVSHRKSHRSIRSDVARNDRKEHWGPGVGPRALSTDAEKQRLQAAFAWRGGNALPQELLPGKLELPGAGPGPVPGSGTAPREGAGAQVKAAVPVPGPKGARGGTQEQLFEEIMGEIEERKKFLDSMRILGAAKEHEARIQAEIQQRVRELESLHDRICSVEEEGAGVE